MNDRFISLCGYGLTGTSFILVFCGLILLSSDYTWMFFPLALGSMVTGLSLIHLMKNDKSYQKESKN